MSAPAMARTRLGESVRLADGAAIVLRQIGPEDVARLRRLGERLSPRTVYRRFMTLNPRLSDRDFEFLTHVDHLGREALVATARDEIVGVARYHRMPGTAEAEVAIVVDDAWQRRGVGRILAQRLIARARRQGIRVFSGTMLSENRAAQALLSAIFPHGSMQVRGPELTFRADLGGMQLDALRPTPTELLLEGSIARLGG